MYLRVDDHHIFIGEEHGCEKIMWGVPPYSVTEDHLQELYSGHGTAESSQVIADRMTGRSRVCVCVCVCVCFVEMSAQEEAQKADGGLEASVSHLKR